MHIAHCVKSCTVLLLFTLCVFASEVTIEELAINPIVPNDASALHNAVHSHPKNISTILKPDYISDELIADVTALRRKIHKHAELSGNETITAQLVSEYVSQFDPDECMKYVGGQGLLYLFRMGAPKKGRRTILFRADMDALPIQESPKSAANTNESNYLSIHPGVFHGCGHDGHTAIVSGMASVITSLKHKYRNNTQLNADVVLLFQPAEETGAGATAMIKDHMFSTFADGIMSRVDAAFALHNLPGHDRATVLLKRGTFAAASKGVRIELRGETSHAAQPERGRSPAGALAKIIHDLEELATLGRTRQLPQFKDFILLTVVHAHLGTAEVAYGTTPGEARVMVTVRTYRNEDMSVLVAQVKSIVEKACEDKQLSHEITFSDEFYATVNEDEDTKLEESKIEMVRQAAVETNLKTKDMTEPFRWSEDFGNFQFKGSTYFGMGAGKDYPSLHNDDYDFPDDLIAPALSVFGRLTEKLIISHENDH